MAFPVMNSPTFPSIADASFMPPKLEDMPIVNPGPRYYRCADGVTRLLTEDQAINLPGCSVVEAPPFGLEGRRIQVVYGLGQASPSPASPGPGTPQGNPQGGPPSGGDRNFDEGGRLDRFYSPQWPSIQVPAYGLPPGVPCAWEKDSAGNDIYVCRPQIGVPTPPQVLVYGPVSYPTRTFFPLFY